MIRRLLLSAALFALAANLCSASLSAATVPPPPVVASTTLHYFSTADAAQAHCPRDVVVWLNIPSGIYHYKGERWYGAHPTRRIRVRKRSHCCRRSREREQAMTYRSA